MTTIDDYMENLDNDPKKNEPITLPRLKKGNILVSQDDFLKIFKVAFKKICKKEFISDENSTALLETLVNYFYKNDNFLNSEILIKDLNSPSHNKGLLLIGNFGLGKSMFLKTIEFIFNEFHFNKQFNYKMFSATKVIQEFEKLENQSERNYFYEKHSKGIKCYDDIKSERDASNYGKVNVFKDILIARFENDMKTILTCNFDENFPGDYGKALDEFGTKYDGRVYDRIFEMFNIIVVNGTSKRN